VNQMNKKALSNIGWIITTMDNESRKLNPPVNRIEKITKNDPFRSLVFTILSARTRDESTIIAAGNLLKAAPNPKKLGSMDIQKIEKLVQRSGFYRMKAKNLKKAAKMLVDKHGGKVPQTMEELIELPGVGRKTANIILAYSFGIDAIAVDTHVHRISNRLGIVKTETPGQTEAALIRSIPRRYWRPLNHAFVSYGQTVCIPRNPKCSICKIRRLCWRVGI